MPDLRPFRGIRYSALAGDPADLMAPPYDVITPQEHLALCQRSRHNIVRLDLGERTSASAAPSPDWYERAGASFGEWRSGGVLASDPEPAFYLYTQEFEHQGQRRRRKLLLGALRLEPYETGRILPHETTMPGPKADRLRLMQACRANLSPILAFFPDPDGRINDLLDSLSTIRPALAFADEGGSLHELRLVWSPRAQDSLCQALAPLPLYIADGHHRYETALVYQQLQRAALPGESGELPADFVLCACMSGADPGFVIRPTHRLVRWEGGPDVRDVLERAEQWFSVEALAPATLACALELTAKRRDEAMFVVYDSGSKSFSRLEMRDARAMQDAPYPERSPLRRLPAAVLGHGFVQRLLGEWRPTLEYEADPRAAIRAVDSGAAGAHSRLRALAGLLPGVRPSELIAVVDAGERMPPKSTFFWPKPLTGIVLRSLEKI